MNAFLAHTMLQLEDLHLMAALAQSNSLSAAARRMNVTASALSMRLKRLEHNLGANLAVRSAHRLSLSAEGETLAADAAEVLSRLTEIAEAARNTQGKLSGALRVVAPFGYGRLRIAPALVRFATLHPELKITLMLKEVPWPSRDDADLVIHIGEVKDSSWVAYRLAANERWLCASPDYIRRRGVPISPKDLITHDCICIRENNDDVTLWHFRPRQLKSSAAGEARQSQRIDPSLSSNDGEVARLWAERGLGIVLRSQWDLDAAIAAGRLVRVLADWEFDRADIVALVPSRKGMSQKVERFIECLKVVSTAQTKRAHTRD